MSSPPHLAAHTNPILLLIVAVSAFSFGGILIVATWYQPVVPGFRGTHVVLLGGLAIGVIATAGFICRFRRTRPVPAILFFSVLTTLLGTGLFGAVFGILNGLLDRGPETQHVQRILTVTRHHVEVQHWLADAPPQRVRISKAEREQIAAVVEKAGEVGAYLEIGVKPGRFGAPWISSYRLVEHLPRPQGGNQFPVTSFQQHQGSLSGRPSRLRSGLAGRSARRPTATLLGGPSLAFRVRTCDP